MITSGAARRQRRAPRELRAAFFFLTRAAGGWWRFACGVVARTSGTGQERAARGALTAAQLLFLPGRRSRSSALITAFIYLLERRLMRLSPSCLVAAEPPPPARPLGPRAPRGAAMLADDSWSSLGQIRSQLRSGARASRRRGRRPLEQAEGVGPHLQQGANEGVYTLQRLAATSYVLAFEGERRASGCCCRRRGSTSPRRCGGRRAPLRVLRGRRLELGLVPHDTVLLPPSNNSTTTTPSRASSARTPSSRSPPSARRSSTSSGSGHRHGCVSNRSRIILLCSGGEGISDL